MARLQWNRLLVRIAGIALLAGCGGAQSTVPAGVAVQPQTTRRAPAGDLLYVVGHTATWAYVYVLSFPAGRVVYKISKQITGLCSDRQGNVYMTQSFQSTSTIFVYRHGAKKPMATLSDPDNGAASCAVNPKTGDLAVGNVEGGTLLIYPHGQGKPKRYYLWLSPNDLTYDSEGNLFVLGGNSYATLGELINGKFKRVILSPHVPNPTGLQWDGKHIAVGGEAGSSSYYYYGQINRYAIDARKGSLKGSTTLSTDAARFFVRGSTLIVSDGYTLYFFSYPAGGEPTKTIKDVDEPGSMTVSVAP
jgi:hypothetical protein